MYYKDLGGKSRLAEQYYEYGIGEGEARKKKVGSPKHYRSRRRRRRRDYDDDYDYDDADKPTKLKIPFVLRLAFVAVVGYIGLLILKSKFETAFPSNRAPSTVIRHK